MDTEFYFKTPQFYIKTKTTQIKKLNGDDCVENTLVEFSRSKDGSTANEFQESFYIFFFQDTRFNTFTNTLSTFFEFIYVMLVNCSSSNKICQNFSLRTKTGFHLCVVLFYV